MSELAKNQEFEIIEQSRKNEISNSFVDYLNVANEWATKAYEIKVISEEQEEQIQVAKEAHKFLKAKRLDLEKTRKSLKEKSLAEGRFIDSVAKELAAIIEPAEKHLEIQAKYAETQAWLRKQELKKNRAEQLMPYASVINFNELQLDIISDDAFQTILYGSKARFEQEQQRLKAEEEERQRIQKQRELFNTRSFELRGYHEFFDKADKALTLDTSEEEYQEILSVLVSRKKQKDEEIKNLKKEVTITKKTVNVLKKQVEQTPIEDIDSLKAKLSLCVEALEFINKYIIHDDCRLKIAETLRVVKK